MLRQEARDECGDVLRLALSTEVRHSEALQKGHLPYHRDPLLAPAGKARQAPRKDKSKPPCLCLVWLQRALTGLKALKDKVCWDTSNRIPTTLSLPVSPSSTVNLREQHYIESLSMVPTIIAPLSLHRTQGPVWMA